MNKLKIVVLVIALLFLGDVKAQQPQGKETVVAMQSMMMQFMQVRFNVKPNTPVKINFTNLDDMSHNFLITKPGKRLAVVTAAMKLEEQGPAMNYIPKSGDVLWSIPVISTGQSASISFTAPAQPGAYPYVCTYPGHGFTMYGVMYVSNDGKMPAMKTDTNIPESRREDEIKEVVLTPPSPSKEGSSHHMDHPYENIPPFLYRTFMDDSGPASIAVSLPQDLSYCWDAGQCRLRYAWSGGFLDNSIIWKGHVDASSKILGTIFYRDNSQFPITIDGTQADPEIRFKGYRLVDKYPEFHYTIDGTDIYELILPKEDGKGLIRNFRIPQSKNTIWFDLQSSAAAVTYDVSAGTWVDGKLKLSPEQAKKFSIAMTNYALVYNTRKKK